MVCAESSFSYETCGLISTTMPQDSCYQSLLRFYLSTRRFTFCKQKTRRLPSLFISPETSGKKKKEKQQFQFLTGKVSAFKKRKRGSLFIAFIQVLLLCDEIPSKDTDDHVNGAYLFQSNVCFTDIKATFRANTCYIFTHTYIYIYTFILIFTNK